MNMEEIECSETSAYKIQTLRNYPEESMKHSEHGESLKSRIHFLFVCNYDIRVDSGFFIKQNRLVCFCEGYELSNTGNEM